TAPPDPVIGYIIEAGAVPGSSNLGGIDFLGTATSYMVTGVAAGRYYVRMRAIGPSNTTAPATSNEVVVDVAGDCTTPGAPDSLGLVPVGTPRTVFLAWSPASGFPTTYILEAGSAPRLSNLANVDLASDRPNVVVNNVASGVYFVRVRARNACGT